MLQGHQKGALLNLLALLQLDPADLIWFNHQNGFVPEDPEVHHIPHWNCECILMLGQNPNNVRMKKKTLHKLLGILEDGIWEDLRNVCNHVIGDWCFLFAGNHGLQRARLGFWLDDWREGKPTRESASYLPGATQLSLIIFTTRLNPLNYSISKKNYGGQ